MDRKDRLISTRNAKETERADEVKIVRDQRERLETTLIDEQGASHRKCDQKQS
jgi:hypothetical protein